MPLARRWQMRINHWSFVALFLAAVVLLMWLSRTYHAEFDWTRGGRNSLAPATIAVVQKLDQPLTLTVYASARQGNNEPTRALIQQLQRYKKDIAVEYVDPDAEPGRARAAGVQVDGEVIATYRDNKENIGQFTEETFANAVARLARAQDRWVVFLSGHGERRPQGEANHDYGIFVSQLHKRGIKTRHLNLNEGGQIPQNTAVLVIADPQTRLLPGELASLERFLTAGGNLLWLAEPGDLRGLQPIAERLGIEFVPGTVVDPNSAAVTNQDPSFLIVAKYSNHPTVRNLNAMTLFPTAAAIKTINKDGWRAQVLLDTLPSAWAERGANTRNARLDPGSDTRGPLSVGVALARDLEKREQRAIAVGDADFLSNTYLGNGGNLDLGMNLLNWVSSDEAYIDLPSRRAPDAQLTLTQNAQFAIAFGFLIALPLFLLTTGIVIWWRRRRR